MPPPMLSVSLTLQYMCTAKMGSKKEKIEYGGDCPKDVACSKMSKSDYKAAYGESAPFEGVYAECAASPSAEACNLLCKVTCKDTDEIRLYDKVIGGTRVSAGFYYYCPKGKQKYNIGGLSTVGIVFTVFAVLVFIALVACCVWVCMFRKKAEAALEGQSRQAVVTQVPPQTAGVSVAMK